MPFINIRFATNVSELKANLAQGIQQIEVTRAAAEKMAKSLGGDNIVAAAHKMAAAVAQIGGAANLTASNQARVNAVMTKAVEVMEASGKGASDVAQHFRELAAATHDAATKTGVFDDSLKKMAAAFTVGALVERLTTVVVSSLIDWGKESFRTAGALVDLSAKTGLTTETLQRMDFAGKQSGVTLDALSDAAFKLGVRLGQGGGGVRKAVEDLGLSYQALKAQSPDQQFNTVIKALESMSDTQERNRIGVELFGKSFQGIAATVVKGYTDMANSASVSSDAQIKAIDEAADAWDRFVARQKTAVASALGNLVLENQAVGKMTDDQLAKYKQLRSVMDFAGAQKFALEVGRQFAKQIDIVLPKPAAAPEAFSAEMRAARAEVALLTAAQKEEIQTAQALGKTTEEITDRFGISETALRVLGITTKEYEDAQRKAEEASRRGAAAAKELAAEMKRLHAEFDKFTHQATLQSNDWLKNITEDNRKQLHAQIADYIAAADEAEKFADRLSKAFDKFSHTATLQSNDWLKDINEAGAKGLHAQIQDVIDKDKEAKRGVDDLAQAFAQLAQVSGGKFGGIVQDIARIVTAFNLAVKAVDAYRKATTDAQKVAAAVAGAAAVASATGSGSIGSRVVGGAITGAGIGSAFPGVGTAVGAGVGGTIGLFRGLYDAKVSAEQLRAEVRRLREAYVYAAGGIDLLQRKALEAGTNLSAMLNAKTPEAYARAIDDLNQKLQFQAGATKTLQDTIDKYKFKIKELGPAWEAQHLDEKAQELYKDYTLLIAGGINQDTILKRMKKSFNDFVREAIASGTAIPEALKPMIQRMIELGLLTDKSGHKFGSLEETGLQFTKTMTTQFESLIEVVKRLAEAIARAFGLPPPEWAGAPPHTPPGPPGTGNPGTPGPGGGEGGGIGKDAIARWPTGSVLPSAIAPQVSASSYQHALSQVDVSTRTVGGGSVVQHNTVNMDNRGALLDTYGLKQLARKLQNEGGFWQHTQQNKDGAYTKARAAMNLPV